MIDLYTASVLVFVVFLAVIVYYDRKNITREGILLIRKTQRGKGFLMKLGSSFPRFWNVYAIIGVIVGFFVSVWGTLFLLDNAIKALISDEVVGGLSLLVPSFTSEPVIGPGFFAVPFWYWIISLAVLVLVHEGSHAVVAIREKLPLKSLGWGLLAIIPLAFVEPDEEKLEKRKPMTQLKVFAAGSFANFLLAGLSALILLGMSMTMFVPTGVGYQGIVQDFPIDEANLTGTIKSINGIDVQSLKDLNNALEGIGPNETITITAVNKTGEFTYQITTVKPSLTEYSPDTLSLIIINMERVMPGTIEFSENTGKFISSVLGNDNFETWGSLNYEISKWEYIQEAYPSMSYTAERQIARLETRLADHDEPGYIGILGVFTAKELAEPFQGAEDPVNFFTGLLFFLVIINFGVGLANLLPIKPLDGGRMWDIVFKKYIPKHAKKVTKWLGIATFIIILANFIFPYLPI